MYRALNVDDELTPSDSLLSFDRGRLEKLLKHSLPIAINTFWKELTKGALADDEIVEKMNLLGISFHHSYFACAIFAIETPPILKPNVSSKGVYPDILYDELAGYLNRRHFGYLFTNEKNELVFILNFNNPDPSESPYNSLVKIIKDIGTAIRGSYGRSESPKLFAGVGDICPHIYQISLSYSQAEESLKRTFFHDGVNVVYSWEEEAECMQAPVQYPYERENDLINAIFEGDRAKAFENLTAFFRELHPSGVKYVDPGLIKIKILELFLALERRLRKYEISLESFLRDSPSLIAYGSGAVINELSSNSLLKENFLMIILYIEEQRTFRDLRESVTNLIEKIILALSNKMESVKTSSYAAVQQAITYIQNHFHEKLTLRQAAQIACLNPCYFSLQFKRETGMNFVDYLKETRINKAKELLKRIDLKVSEIAETVGFQNKQYFSDAFKRHTGQTPLEYRRRLISN
ncbi:MAG: helix-turn-helix domain-containing protein [Firmicutes bacterium]|nr:helix-turn-helix domain-containing protein [Bacillota bacterium]